MSAEVDRASEALHFLDPECDRDTWHKIGRAAIAAGLTIDEIDTWSSTAGNYSGAKDTHAAFKTITPEGGTSARTLFRLAIDAGWIDTDKRQSKPTAKAKPKPAPPPRKPAPGKGAADVWERCQAATNEHGYIAAKQAAGVPLDNLRVVPVDSQLRIAGASMAGYLALPAFTPDKTIQSIQFIPPGAGKKLNLPGVSMAGASFTVGTPIDGSPINLNEGIGGAWSCWQSNDEAALSTFGFGNMAKVARDLRQRYPKSPLRIVADVGKESQCEIIATEVGGLLVKLPDGWPQNSDANDLSQRDGADVLELLLERATEPPKPEPLLKPVSVFDVLSNPSPPPGFVWADYLPRGTVSLLGAHGGTGKSTLALMLEICAVLGIPLFGVATELVKAMFVSLEDGANIIRHRLAHICRTWAIDPEQLRDRLLIVDGTEHPELFAAETRGAGETTSSYFELCKLVQSENIGLVVVDNASDAFGGDEIQRRQVRAFMRALAEVARLNDCAVLLLAHVDKTTSRNRAAAGGEAYSGSTAWHNSARSRLFLTRGEDDLLTLEHQKSNLGKKHEPITLTWPDGGLPMLASDAPTSGFTDRMQGRADDDRAIALLRLITEFEGRGQFCSPMTQARNNIFAMLRSEPEFQKLKLNSDSTRRIVNQCQRAKWLDVLDYRSIDRKPRQRWVITTEGRLIAGLPAPTAPTAPTYHEGAQSALSSIGGAPTAPTYAGGTGGEERTHEGASEVPQ